MNTSKTNSAESLDTIIARLLLNTKRAKRQDSIIQVVTDIKALRSHFNGDLKMVSSTIGLTSDMLNQFLSVERLTPEVFQLVAERKIDSVSAVHYIARFPALDQSQIAEKYIEGTLTTQDIRALGPLRTTFSDTPIADLTSRLLASKNVKISVIYFQLKGSESLEAISNKVGAVLNETDIVSIENKGMLGILKLTAKGEQELRNIANQKGLSLKEYFAQIIST